MDHDDDRIGRIYSRREAVGLFGAAGVTLIGGQVPRLSAAAPKHRLASLACIARPEQAEGPYFSDAHVHRSDIRSDPTTGEMRDGARLDLSISVSRVTPTECQPLEGALVDVWQCDALGIYSDFEDRRGGFDTRGQLFLRGHQETAADGTVEFVTIYPGWYGGRTVHIHLKIRTEGSDGASYDFTTQMYFDDDLTDRVLEGEPYAQHGPREMRNADDRWFREDGGEQLILPVTREGDHFRAEFALGLELA